MGGKCKDEDEKYAQTICTSIEDYIFKNHMLCSIDEIAAETGISKTKCRKIMKKLVSEGKISLAYKRKGRPDIFIPTYMFNEVLRTQHKPPWMKNYFLKRKKNLVKKLESLRQEIYKYEIIERLLYGTGNPLSEAVAYVLDYLEFKDVEVPANKDTYDVSFVFEGKKYILEIEGTAKQGNKNKVNQLDGWIKAEMDKGLDPERLVGILVVNHYRDKNPKQRGEPLTDQAKKFLRYHKFRFFTTYFLYNILKQVIEGKLPKEKARRLVVKGEEYD